MEADYSSSTDPFALPLSLPTEAADPEVDGPTHFAKALKRARFARGWTQATLAKQLAITKRSIVSWETGARIPSVGMVVLLLDVLCPGEELSLHHELFCAYIVDDVEHQQRRKDAAQHQDDPQQLQRVQRVRGQVLLLPQRATMAVVASESHRRGAEEQVVMQWEEPEPPQPTLQATEHHALEPLFALMAQLQHHPELISVARDFIRELAPGD